MRFAPWLVLSVFALGCDGTIAGFGGPVTPAPVKPSDIVPSACEGFVTPIEARHVVVDASWYRAAIDQLFSGRPVLQVSVPAAPVGYAAPFGRGSTSARFSTLVERQQVSEYDFEDAWDAAQLISRAYISYHEGLTGDCLKQPMRTPACLDQTLRQAGELLLGHPLEGPALAGWTNQLADLQAAGLSSSQALEATLRAMLTSTDFLFRPEVGRDGHLDAFEKASLISSVLQGRPPDGPLWDDAVADQLDEAAVRRHVRRLLSRPAEVPSLRRFLRELFQWDTTLNVNKDTVQFPYHAPAILAEDTEMVVAHLVDEYARAGLLRQLLTSDLAYIRIPTYQNWGLPKDPRPAAPEFRRMPGRTGILTHPAWLSGFSEADHNHLVRRGRFVRERLLCGAVPSLPPNLAPFVQPAPNLSLRERITRQTADASCQACHRLMDPLGYAFEAFDHVGRPQTMDNGMAVQTDGTITDTASTNGAYRDVADFMTQLADSGEVRTCFLSQVFTSFTGRAPTPRDTCLMQQLEQVYEDSGEDLLAVIEELMVWQTQTVRVTEETP